MLEIYQEIINLISKGESAVLATVVSKQGSAPRGTGAKMLVKRDGTVSGSVGGGKIEHLIRNKSVEMIKSGESEVMHFDLSELTDEAGKADYICGGQVDILLEPIIPPETLYLFGAGHISESAAAIGKRLAFRVVVIDPRAEFNNKERFPNADSLVVEDYADSYSQLDINRKSYIVIVTHGHAFDEQCLQFAVSTEAKYIGMIGSRQKVREIKDHLLQQGISESALDRVHAPIGLSIGAETPAEIAISIIAEIIKVRRGCLD